ncbi:MAG TPA: circularly permuted type 2 ATP-grasp protein [Candidatus Omnitrophota bacterium]|nr:circularly permuted type 2 ATP-grasp protein [Candidatus Omnitrophota bacterium]
MDFSKYKTDGFYDELFAGDGNPREIALPLIKAFESLPSGELQRRQEFAEQTFLNTGVTFTVTGDKSGADRIFPFDLIPRLIDESEWLRIEKGLKQRIKALNLFLQDIYHDQRILKEKIIPAELIHSGKNFLKECVGLNPPQKVWCHITGTDLVRDGKGVFHVLEDNLRCPSGVSYVIENRDVVKKTIPEFFRHYSIAPVENYPQRLLETLRHIAPPHRISEQPTVVVLTPGIHNSAYFEHAFLAQRMGAELVEGKDLVAQDDGIYMRTTNGSQKVDVIYRRIDDSFLDPHVFRPDSHLGVPGLINAYRKGQVALANAPGTGIADDKVIYKFVPDMIRFYLSEETIIPNVPTYLCWDKKERDYALDNMEKLVIKPANEAGGYGMLIGPASTAAQRAEFAEKIKSQPRNYLAQPTLALSRAPTLVKEKCFEGRHVDLRPYILYGKDVYVMPGGLTRVALKKGSLVVNSSQGGGSKDTWVIRKRGVQNA